MPTSGAVQTTDFTQDVIGRFVCNGLDEALRSADQSARPDARPFDTIIIGGGSFGGVIAQYLLRNDRTHSHRILVLEAGSFVLPEHVQNMPMLGLDVPGPTTWDPGVLRNQVWGLPWRSDVPDGFTGLAYMLGGRSAFFGGWSPRLLSDEMPAGLWPGQLKTDLETKYFAQSAEQIGTDTTNDFMHGALHVAMRKQLFDGINGGAVSSAVPLAQLPLHLPNVPAAQQNLLKLEAPLAVQGRSARAGFFPMNKFSSVPLLVEASRTAQFETGGDDVKKRLMVVPHCRVKTLVTEDAGGGQRRVTGLDTTAGFIPVGAGGKVVIALGTIESTRLALLSFGGTPHYDRIGKSLIAHLRSNLTIRIPRAALTALAASVKELQSSALFVKGKFTQGGNTGFFHLQITAAGLDKPSADSEAELFKKIPDVDTYLALRQTLDDHVTITIRGIGEMEADNPNSFVAPDGEHDQDGVARARVFLTPSARDNALWNAMDACSDDVARVFAGNQPFEVWLRDHWVTVQPGADLQAVLPYTATRDGGRRDGLGTTHHEAGSLRMGTSPATSVTDPNGRFHDVVNAYALGPAAFPTLGSPNPMLTGVALARRLADHLVAPGPFQAEPGFTVLFNGIDTGAWKMSTIRNQPPDRSNPGRFIIVDGALEAVPGSDLGLYWHTTPLPRNFILRLEWRQHTAADNSGVFIRFPDPTSKGYDNTAYVGVNFGLEVQIDVQAAPDGAPQHKTGAIYGLQGPAAPDALPLKPIGEWNLYEIRADEQAYTVSLNGQVINQYAFPGDPQFPDRALPTAPNAPRYFGLQTHPTGDSRVSRVAFRKIRIQAI